MSQEEKDNTYMQQAIALAKKGAQAGEVPVGALLVHGERIVGEAYNSVETYKDPTAHAEMQVLRQGCQQLQSKYLITSTLYTTLEPCPMCAMACYWTQVGRIVYAVTDPKRGYSLYHHRLIHPKTTIVHGPCAYESRFLLQEFFRALR